MLFLLIAGLTKYCSHSEMQECRTWDMKEECREQKADSFSCSRDAYIKRSVNVYKARNHEIIETVK